MYLDAMKQLLFLLISIFACASARGQAEDTVFITCNRDPYGNQVKYRTDTIVFPSEMMRNYLVGTTRLPGTHNSMAAFEYGLSFINVTKSACRQDVTAKGGKDHINGITATDTSLTIDMTIYDNCCYDFLCDIRTDSTGTLHLLYSGYGTYCSCECCFGLVYHLKIDRFEDTPELKAVMINDLGGTKRMIKKK